MVEKNKLYTIEITGISSDGNGIGTVDGFTVFVPVTAPGDVAEVLIVKVLSRYAVGRLMSIKKPSGHRIDASCGAFRRCGGCHMQHIKYDAQLKIKRTFIEDAMRRIGGFKDFSCDDMLGMDSPYRYRNKCVFPIGRDKNGETVSGFYARRSHDIIPIGDCMMGSETNSRINEAVLQYMSENNVLPYDEHKHKGVVRRVFIRNSRDESEIMVVVSINASGIPSRERLIKRLRNVSDKIVSIYLNINTEKNNSVLGRENKLIYGKPEIDDSLCGINFRISPSSFYQINTVMTEHLYNRAIEYADISPEDTVLDVYCGIGTISLAAAGRAKQVVGVEIVEQAIINARDNAAANSINNASFYAESAEQAVPQLIEGGMRPDIVILDPPRKGSDERTLSAICSAMPKRIVYVSCNPATLARDAKFLAELGYVPLRCTGVDMFPHTAHVETVCLLSKLKSTHHIEVEIELDKMDLTKAESKATYAEIKEYVFDKYDLKVSQLYIAQVKRKHGIIERINYNIGKGKNRVPQVTPEKEAAIEDALRHFKMIE